MENKYKITGEQLHEIQVERNKNKDKNADKRLEVLFMRGEGEKYPAIAEKTGFHPTYASLLVAKYFKEGIGAILGKKREANRRNLSFADETEFLAQFKEKAEKGEVITARDIRAAYEEKIGHKCGNGQIYRLLARHNCRKLKPRGQHSKKASEEEIDSSKKLTLGWKI